MGIKAGQPPAIGFYFLAQGFEGGQQFFEREFAPGQVMGEYFLGHEGLNGGEEGFYAIGFDEFG
jgi:hypothetical protein